MLEVAGRLSMSVSDCGGRGLDVPIHCMCCHRGYPTVILMKGVRYHFDGERKARPSKPQRHGREFFSRFMCGYRNTKKIHIDLLVCRDMNAQIVQVQQALFFFHTANECRRRKIFLYAITRVAVVKNLVRRSTS